MVDNREEVDGSGEGSSRSASQSTRRSTTKQRLTDEQNHRLERTFNECIHPNEDVRIHLSRELGLSPRQILFWFQNRRTQLKVQQEKAENVSLRVENDKIRHENIVMEELLTQKACPSCVGLATFINEQLLRIENTRLKEEVQKVSSDIRKYIGRPISQLHVGDQGITNGPSLDLLYNDSSATTMLPFGFVITEFDKSIMTDIARDSMTEMIKLLQNDAPFWINSLSDGRKVLDINAYESNFPRANKIPNVWIESSKDSGIVFMNCLELVKIFMDANKWMEVFPTIVSKAAKIQEISTGLMSNQNGLLQLMYEEIHMITPLVPTCKFYLLRFCQQIDSNIWAIVDFSYDSIQKEFDSQCQARRLPSGCYIEDMLDGHSKVTWMEHMHIEDRRLIPDFYKELISSGLAYGAERRLATLQRMCGRLNFQMDSNTLVHYLGEVNPSPHAKRYLMKLSQRMVSSFCSSINSVDGQQQMVTKLNDGEVHTTLNKFTNHGCLNSMVLSATTTIWLPFSPQKIFDYLRNENTRPHWDVISKYNFLQEVGRIACGFHPANYISILKAFNASIDNELILQETCIDSSSAFIVYCHVNEPTINRAMSGEDLSFIPLYPSGFMISPDRKMFGEMSSGALVTIMLQISESNVTSCNISQESTNRVNNILEIIVDQIKVALK